ncbi:hypothetical protein V2A60_006874 [Cordyceps javanica]
MKFEITTLFAHTLVIQGYASGRDLFPFDKKFPHGIDDAHDKLRGRNTAPSKQTKVNRVRIAYKSRGNTSIMIGHTLRKVLQNRSAASPEPTSLVLLSVLFEVATLLLKQQGLQDSASE